MAADHGRCARPAGLGQRIWLRRRHALGTDELSRIVGLQVDLLAARLASRRIRLEVSQAAREWLALTGFDPAYGARPLRRLVQTAIGDPLARLLISGQVADGQQVHVDQRDGEDLVLTVA